MGKKRRVALIATLVAALGGVAWFILHEPPEPVYRGKPLRVWLEQYSKSSSYLDARLRIYDELRREPDKTSIEAENAIHAIGTNAIPTLLRMAGKPYSPIKSKVTRWLQNIRWLHFRITTDDHILAGTGFYVLGSRAKSAAPALIDLLKHGDFVVQSTAADCLGSIGPDAEPAIPLLMQRAGQATNNTAQWSATMALGEIHRRPDLVVPLLVTNLSLSKTAPRLQLSIQPGTTCYSLIALGNYGTDAKSAVSAIVPYLTDPLTVNRMAATNALKKIDPEAAAKAGIK